jgi:small-conductance mechanosensitive channel
MLFRIVCLLVTLWAASAHAALPEAPDAPRAAQAGVATAAPSAEATLTYFNRPVATFRSPLLGVSAADRVQRAQGRIRAQLDMAGPHQVSEKRESVGVLVQIDGATSFIVTAEDADRLANETVEVAATAAATALRQVVRESRESRDVDAIARAVGSALAATAGLALFVWLLQKLRRNLSRRLLAATRLHVSRLQVGGVQVLRRERIATLIDQAMSALYGLVVLVVGSEWLGFVLGRFPFTRAWGELLNSYLFDLAARMGGAVLRAVPDLFTAVVILLIARFITRVLHSFFERVQSAQVQVAWLDADVAVPTRRIAKVIVWLFAVAMAYPYLPGAQTEAFKGLSVLVGLMISLGASNLVGQAASGLILTYGRVYRKGEYVRIADQEGTITDLGIFATRLRTGLGEELTLSNSTILAGTTRNYSRAVQGPGFVLDTTVTIGYDTPWRQVHAMLCEAARRTPGVLAEPPPQVFQTALSDWYPEYRLVCQAIPAEPRPRATVLSALHASIQDVFNEYGVQIMSPQYFEDPPTPKIVPPDQWFAPPAAR